MNFLCQIGLRQIQILGTLDRPLSTSQKVAVVRVSGGSSIGRSRRTSENNAFSCIFRNKVKLAHLFRPKCGLRPLLLHILDSPLRVTRGGGGCLKSRRLEGYKAAGNQRGIYCPPPTQFTVKMSNWFVNGYLASRVCIICAT